MLGLFSRFVAATLFVLTVVPHSGQADELVVAVPAPLSGERASLGLSIQTAAQMIAADRAASSPRLTIMAVDDGCDAKVAAAGATKAAGASAIVGHPCAAAVRAVSQAYVTAGKLFIAAGSTIGQAPSLQRLPARIDSGEALGQLLAERVSKTAAAKVAVIRDKTQLNRALAARVEAILQRRGISMLPEVINGGDRDHDRLAARLAQGGVTHVALLTFAIEGAFISAATVALLPEVQIIGPDHIAQPDFPSLAGPAATARVNVLLPPTLDAYVARFPRAKALADRMQAAGVAPTREALETAAALEAVAAAAGRGARTAAAFATALQQPSETVLGTLYFTPQGEATVGYWTPHRWLDGKLLPIP